MTTMMLQLEETVGENELAMILKLVEEETMLMHSEKPANLSTTTTDDAIRRLLAEKDRLEKDKAWLEAERCRLELKTRAAAELTDTLFEKMNSRNAEILSLMHQKAEIDAASAAQKVEFQREKAWIEATARQQVEAAKQQVEAATQQVEAAARKQEDASKAEMKAAVEAAARQRVESSKAQMRAAVRKVQALELENFRLHAAAAEEKGRTEAEKRRLEAQVQAAVDAGAHDRLRVETELVCQICMFNPSNVILLPCFHRHYCSECLDAYRKTRTTCPCCKALILGSVPYIC